MLPSRDTIVARATPPGCGGVGIVRVSGPLVSELVLKVLDKKLSPRVACFCRFLGDRSLVVDEGIALLFPGPNSFTGEDVFEFHGHGSPVVLDLIISLLVSLGARIAKPGEFSERAFLNDKMDLTQAEAVADLISASSVQSAHAAMRSLQGDFSLRIHSIVDGLVELRSFIEAAIDFPDDDIDFLAESNVQQRLEGFVDDLKLVLRSAKQGVLLRDGISIVILGKPNAGKSSLLNRLALQETAIVTDIPGTTRDVVKVVVHVDGMPVQIVDTAGIRPDDEHSDSVESEGIRRTWEQVKQCDHVFIIYDCSEVNVVDPFSLFPELKALDLHAGDMTLVRNKIDLIDGDVGRRDCDGVVQLSVSVKDDLGVDDLRLRLKEVAGLNEDFDGEFMARRRHLEALDDALGFLVSSVSQRQGELVAEELRQAQRKLGEITGVFTNEDLLDNIFRKFCIGK